MTTNEQTRNDHMTATVRMERTRDLAETAAIYGAVSSVKVDGEYNRAWYGTAEIDGHMTHWQWFGGRGWCPDMDQDCNLRDQVLVGRYFG
jgi:hypothetical protein